MTQYPDVMEALTEIAGREMYDVISSIMNKRDNEAWKLHKKESDFVDKFYTLGKVYPPLNGQGVFEHTDMVTFIMKFRELWYEYYADELKESWGNIYHLSDHTEEDDV